MFLLNLNLRFQTVYKHLELHKIKGFTASHNDVSQYLENIKYKTKLKYIEIQNKLRTIF